MPEAMFLAVVVACCLVSVVLGSQSYPAANGVAALCAADTASPAVFGNNPFYTTGYAAASTAANTQSSICNVGSPDSTMSSSLLDQTSCTVRLLLLFMLRVSTLW